MKIESFAPEMRISPKDDLEAKLVNNDVIAHAELQQYAQAIISHLAEIETAHKDEKISFVIDALSDKKIQRSFRAVSADNNTTLSHDDILILQKTVDRVKKALIEELKGKIDSTIYLFIIDLVRPKTDSPRDKNNISIIFDINNGSEKILKDQQNLNEEYREEIALAHKDFLKLPSHPNVVRMVKYDEQNHVAIYEKRSFVSLSDFLENQSLGKKKFLPALSVLRDCINAALYLDSHGLVLQDIHPSNLGVEQHGQKLQGVLFDLEGLVRKGVEVYMRIGKGGKYGRGLQAPISKFQKNNLYGTGILDENQDNKFKISPYEEVFQFGCCLEDIIEDYLLSVRKDLNPDSMKLVRDLQELVFDMTKSCAKQNGRLDLGAAASRLTVLMQEMEKSKLFS
ncbi:MAG: hypothetical protein KBC69_02570 [Candidatus Magasanikbacteria bacterium]|nr:hypothetical protein [Candidatus Magasanikbacteria bacterium]